jgi:hypothetical protein
VTLADVKAMTFDELQRECQLLHKQLKDETSAREEAMAKAKMRRR